MTAERWQQIEALYAQALALPPARRAAFVAEQAGADEALRAEVASLLDAHVQDPAFLETPFAGIEALPAMVSAAADVDRAVGTPIGPYHVLHVLGRGGMGTVYLAERRTEAFTQQVALKLLRRGLDTEDLLRRFRSEQRILARLRHPHIAHLIDGGATDDGLPYFVMEYVAGEPLPAYCDRHNLTVEARLRLFQQVCRAVQYAHQNLVVHRDLKPSNILVTEPSPGQPADAQVKLLDFGIAKLLDPERGSALTITEAGLRVMTPAYASPEQVRRGPITTATDVYALGVVLYELLTGHRPYRLADTTLRELERIICDTEPPRPSTVITQVEEVDQADGTSQTVTPEQVSRVRGTEADRLRRQLSGDLDTIVLKAMRKDPEHRYATVEQLSEDIGRYLTGQPVLARPATWPYRVSRFVRRNRVLVAAAAVIAGLLVAFSVTTAWQAAQIRAQAAAVAQERDKAEEVVGFLVSLFRSSDPGEARGETVTARELLERGTRRIDEELREQPEVQAEMLGVMGEVYEALGDYAEAEQLARQALARQEALVGPRHAETATALNRLGWIRHLRGDDAGADSILRAALTLRRELLGPDHLDVARTMNDLAVVQQARGDYAATDTLLRDALAIRRAQLGEVHSGVGTTLNNLAALQWRLGDTDRAIAYFEEALAAFQKVYGASHPRIAITLNNLAAAHQVQGDMARAEALYRDALAMRRTLFGDEHPDIAYSLTALANLLVRKGATAEAEPLLAEALAMRRRLLGPDHQQVAATLATLALLKKETGAHAEAETLYREVLAMQRRLLGPDHVDVAETQGNLARVLVRQERPGEAEALYREALATAQATLPEEHATITLLRVDLGIVLVEQGRFEEAEALLRNAIPKPEAVSPEVRAALVQLYEAWGKPEQAASYRE